MTIPFGFDMGMGALKLWSAPGGWQLVSQVATNGRGHLMDNITGLKSSNNAMMVSSEFGSFYVGDGAHEHGRPVENMNFERLTGTPEMRALLYGAWAQYQNEHGPFDEPLSLMVALPLQMMTGELAEEYKKAVKGWLLGTHQFEVDGITHKIEVESVKQTSQPVGALFDYALDHRGKIIPERGNVLTGEVGVISVGFNTVELMVVKERRAFKRFTRGNTLGVRRLFELMNPDYKFSRGEMDAMLRSGFRGEWKEKFNRNLPIWSGEINNEIEDVWEGGKHTRFDKILVVGGGPLILRERLTNQFRGNAWMSDDPVLSIAHGSEKMLLMMTR